MRYWQPLGAETAATRSLPHPENEHPQSVNDLLSCICSNQGIAWIFEHINELFTILINKNMIYQRKNTDSKIIDCATCQTCKHTLSAVEYAILISHYHQTAKAGLLCESIDGPAGQLADNQPDSGGLVDFHRTVPRVMVRVN